jgi:hypothetical protein
MGIGDGSGTVGILEVHIVNKSPAPGNIKEIKVSVAMDGREFSVGLVTPMYYGIFWREKKAPAGALELPIIHIYPKDFLFSLIDGELLTHNNGMTRWLPFFVSSCQPDELQAKGAITVSIMDTTGKKFTGVSCPDPDRNLDVGYE